MEGAKNLAAKAVEALAGEKPEVEKWAAGATEKPSEAELHGKILEFLWWMKKQGYKETTISGKG